MELNPQAPSAPEAPRSGTVRSMPMLAGGAATHAHTVHSALVTLQALGIGAHRLRLRRVGRQAQASGVVVRQWPPAGAPLDAATLVELDLAGLGFTQALPVGMWDSGGETALGTREILEGLDDALEKLKHWFHEGAPLFRLAPEDAGACARWLKLFGFQPEDWPQHLWYPLAALSATLPQMACSEDGCRFVLQTLLGLPVRQFGYRPSYASLPEAALSRLGAQASRLGVDALLGDEAEDVAETWIEVGPVSLETYEYFVESSEGAALLRRVLDLLMPISAANDVEWLVLDAALPPKLGEPAHNARLGINSHMGNARTTAQEADLTLGSTALDATWGVLRDKGRQA